MRFYISDNLSGLTHVAGLGTILGGARLCYWLLIFVPMVARSGQMFIERQQQVGELGGASHLLYFSDDGRDHGLIINFLGFSQG